MNYLYDVVVSHTRTAPVSHSVRRRASQWYLDLDEAPPLPKVLRPLAQVRARDHVGAPNRGLRQNVDALLRERGLEPPGGRMTMLAHPRVAGYVFDPLSLYWCFDPAGELRYVVAEVHNTYGEAHAYVITPDSAGRARVDKALYVSPFYPVDGYYQLHVPVPGERLTVTVTLHRPDGTVFVATVRGRRRPATTRAVLGQVLSRPLSSWLLRAAITRHGIALYRKGLRVHPRPRTHS